MKIWNNLWNHKFSEPFKYPVTLEEAPDYDQVNIF